MKRIKYENLFILDIYSNILIYMVEITVVKTYGEMISGVILCITEEIPVGMRSLKVY